MRPRISAFILASLLLSSTDRVRAQATGRLTGSVMDASGANVPDARVNLYLTNGKTAVLATMTTSEGIFTFVGVRPDVYVLEIEAAGFAKNRLGGIAVDPARETSLPPIKLELQAAIQTVTVSEGVQGVATSNAEITTIVTQRQVENLPVLDRQVSNLFLTQAGVTNSRGETVINGLRTSYANVTLDGINIQDNFIRVNALDYLPNKLTIAQVNELTVSTSNANASIGGGSSQIVLTTPSGGNQIHGSGYWYNRNSELSANDWFNNKNGVARPFLNLNQIGGSLGGPILKDKLFYYGNYEAYRLRQTSPTTRTILTGPARQGMLTYRDASNNVRTFDVLGAGRLGIDPVIQNYLKDVPATGNSTDVGDGLNTTGYAFNARSNETRDNVTAKLDYYRSTRHIFSGSYVWNRDIVDRPDLGLFYTTAPPVFNDNHAHLATVSWRWNPRPTLTNEVRGGFNLSPGNFAVSQKYPTFLLSGLLFDSPVNTFLAQGRATDTYHLQDNASYIRGKHNISFGFQSQMIRTAPYNDGGIVPSYTIGFASNSPYGFSSGDIPGLRANDLGTANGLQASLGGIYVTAAQTFNVTNRTSGFVPGANNLRHYGFDNYSGYVSDNWKLMPRFSLVLGLRYEYFSRLNERDALFLLPQLINNNFVQTLLSNATLDFAGNAVGRPLYNRDLNNFAPNVGFAWNVLGDGKMAVRGGYSVAFVNDDTVEQVVNDARTNSGLSASSSLQNLNGRLTGALQPIPTPVFKVPRTFQDNYRIDPTNAEGLPDPTLRTPYVQQWSFGIQRELKGFVVEGRYVGNHSTKGLRQFDYNQVVIRENGFLADFIRARNNGFLSLAAGRGFNPAYNPAVTGSQPLPLFDQLAGGGALSNPTIRGQIQRGEVGTLGQTYQVNSLNGNINFFRNPFSLGTNTIANYSNSNYHAVQIDVRKRTAAGLQFQANYTYGKVLTDASANGASRGFEPFLDNANPRLERARATFDLRHAFKLNHYIPLPFGAGRRFSYAPLNRVIGGWGLSGFLTLQSGPPVSILSTRGTLNRGARSGQNTAVTALNKDGLDKVVNFIMTGNGPYFVDKSVIGPDSRGVASDGSPPFQGQIFFNPDPGAVGTLQRRYFSGPWYNNYDFAVLKDTKITERHSIQFRADFFNLTNHANFFVGDQNVNSATFGKVTSMFYAADGVGPRLVQFGLYYRF